MLSAAASTPVTHFKSTLRAVVVAMGVNADARRELLGLKVGDSESEPFWSDFIGSL